MINFATLHDFLINSCSNVTMDHIFLIYGSWHLIFAKIPILPFVHQMKFNRGNPNFQLCLEWIFWGNLELMNVLQWCMWPPYLMSWGIGSCPDENFPLRASVDQNPNSMTVRFLRPNCLAIVQSFVWLLVIRISWSLWLPWGVEDHVNSWLVLCLNIWGKP